MGFFPVPVNLEREVGNVFHLLTVKIAIELDSNIGYAIVI